MRVDLGSEHEIRRVVLDAGTSTGDFPRGYALSLSLDGLSWGAPVATGAGTGQLTTVDFSPQRARFVRVEQTGSSGSWWAIADFRVYQ